jgi:hypothetical protein
MLSFLEVILFRWVLCDPFRCYTSAYAITLDVLIFVIFLKKTSVVLQQSLFFSEDLAHPIITRAKIKYVLGRWQRCIKLIFPGFLSRKFDILHFASTGDRMMWDPESNWNRRYPQQGKFTVLRDRGWRSSLEGNVIWWGIRNREEDPWRKM